MESELEYEAPQLVELGDYEDLTRGVGFPLADFFIHFD
ncbi:MULTISPECIES: lasso RiPP family leader peptide-containing protein [unclassified Streptomyces]